jgi:fibro-slime domain-containing protein
VNAPLCHPDFEDATGDDPGIVETTLGADRKPVYARPTGSTPTTHGKAYFDVWYRTNSQYNVAVPVALTLGVVPGSNPARWRYTSGGGGFFVVDGAGWNAGGGGQVISGHNYHFTYELHAQFTYRGGETLTVSGDDDIWVFVNRQLVIDRGGVHPEQSATVNLADIPGLTPGQRYDFDLFFAERHTVSSNLTIETSIELQPAPQIPTAASVSSFTARRGAAGVVLRWRGGNPTVLGYRVYRGRTLLKPRLIVAGPRGAHRYLDRSAPAGPLRYRLQAVRTDGSTAWAGSVNVQRQGGTR